jgi:hypothetical protein
VWQESPQWQDVLDLVLARPNNFEVWLWLQFYYLDLPPVSEYRANAIDLGVDPAEWDRRWEIAYRVSEAFKGKARRSRQ